MEDRTSKQQTKSLDGLKQPKLSETMAPKTQGLRAPSTGIDVKQELNGAYKVVENLLVRALSRKPSNVMTLVLAGWAMQLRDLQRAKEYFVKAHMIEPDNGAVLLGLAHLSRQAHDYQEALNLLNQASSTELTDELRKFLNIMFASVLQKKGQPGEAVKKASEAIVACENDANTRVNLYLKKSAFLERALAYLSDNDLEKAITDFRSAMAVEGKEFQPTGKPLVDLQRALGMLG